MPTVQRNAKVVWNGSLAQGGGTIQETGSGAFGELPVTWASRTERSNGKTSPEELISAAHASCFAMGLSHGLSSDGHAPERLSVSATCFLDKTDDGVRIATMELQVRGRVPGIDADGFRDAAEAAAKGCPVSKALEGNVDVKVEAELEG